MKYNSDQIRGFLNKHKGFILFDSKGHSQGTVEIKYDETLNLELNKFHYQAKSSHNDASSHIDTFTCIYKTLEDGSTSAVVYPAELAPTKLEAAITFVVDCINESNFFILGGEEIKNIKNKGAKNNTKSLDYPLFILRREDPEGPIFGLSIDNATDLANKAVLFAADMASKGALDIVDGQVVKIGKWFHSIGDAAKIPSFQAKVVNGNGFVLLEPQTILSFRKKCEKRLSEIAKEEKINPFKGLPFRSRK